MPQKLCCPQCGHEELQVVNESNVHTTGKNYSAGKGCLGYLLLGPLGLLCGSCGQGQKTQTTNTTYWVCPKCGKKFRNPEDIRATIPKNKAGTIVCGVFLLLFLLLTVTVGVFALADGMPGEVLAILIIVEIAYFGGLCAYCFAKWKNAEKEAKELEEAMAQRLREKSDEN